MPGMTNVLPGSSLLGREVPPAPVSPVTQALHPIGAPALSLGGFSGQQTRGTQPAAPIPAGRSISSLRTPRGTNFIRLAFAAMFLLGFLGLVGFLLKDYLPTLFPSLAGVTAIEQSDKEDIPVSSNPLPKKNPLATATPTLSTEPPLETPPSSVPIAEANSKETPPLGFNPTETVPPKAQTATLEEVAAVVGLPRTVSSASTNILPVETNSQSLEMPRKAASNAESSPPTTTSPTSLTQTLSAQEDDAPPEAKPAVEALKKFLNSTTLAERLPHTLGADLMKPLMERYYTRSTDGPISVDRIQFVRMDPNPELGSGKHCIFSLENKTWEFPVPVMLEEQADGFKVDWLAFVEFKDRLLEKFFQKYQDGPARFHVGIIRHHYFEDGVPNIDRKYAFRVMPAPPNSFQASVFLDKETALAADLRARLPWETHVWAVVELEWKKLGSQQWVELSAVPQMHWYSLPMTSRSVSTNQRMPEEEMPAGISKNGIGKGGATTPNNMPPPGISKNGVGSGSSKAPPPGITKSTPDLPTTIKRPLPAGR